MATEGDRLSVLRTTKVRTAMKGDSSWIKRSNQSGPAEEEEDEKPWIAEVRASRLNSDFTDPADEKTPPKQDPPPSQNTDGTKSPGYLIRGVFTKTDTKPTASSTNGYIGTSSYTKKASDGYKKIAPHTIRTPVEKTEPTEPTLSAEEKEKRTEAASKILDSSARKQRSYVLSAAKKYESSPANDSADSPAAAFIAKRVVICDDDDTGSTPVSGSKQSIEMSVDEPIPSEPSPVKPEIKPIIKPQPTPRQSSTINALSDTLLLTPEPTSKKQVTSPVPETQKISQPKPTSTTSMNEKITQATSVAPVATLKNSSTEEPKPDPTPQSSINPKPVEKTSVLNDNDILDLAGSSAENLVDPVPTSTDLLTGDSLPKTKQTTGSLDLLAVDIIPIDTNTDKLSSDKTTPKIVNTQTVVQTKTDVKSPLQKSVDPPPPPTTTTTDLLSGGSLPKTKQTTGSLDLLAVDIIPIDTNTDKLSSDKTTSKIVNTQTVVQTKTDVKSPLQKSVDPPPPPTTTTTDLLSGGSLPQTKKTTESLDLLAYDVIPIDTDKDKLSTDKTQSTVKTVTSVVTNTRKEGSADPFDPIPIVKESTKSPVELFDPLLSDSNKDPKQTVSVTFEQKSPKSSSPWDKWAVPTIDSAIDDSSSAEPEERDVDTEAKKNLVYIKSYMGSDPTGYGSTRYDSDYVTSSSSSYAYSSPSSTANMTACTYCGSLVGNDSKITIDHLNISCHPECFKCGVCSKPMGDFIHSMFLHRGTVLCENCYSNVI